MAVVASWLSILTVWLIVAPVMVALLWVAERVHRWMHRPRTTLWHRVCRWCGREEKPRALPYDPQHGLETVTHTICDGCLREAYGEDEKIGDGIVIDLAASREEVAERCAVLRGDAA